MSGGPRQSAHSTEASLLRLAVVVLVAIWAVAVFTKHTMGGFAHVLVVLALVFGLIYLVRGSNS